ncbi:MAG: TetR/AcrR family transcriptional regulator [Actinomycetota bacterium]|nr:TetR/AcrR family transcriptional regulator [Actinomycetota bacterium]
MASDTSPTVSAAETYHHGDLANALRRSAAALLAERGVAGFSLREVARRAGVSHAAPAHHFGDARGLLTAVAVEAFQYLTEQTEAAVVGVDDPVEALARLGRAYVTVAVEHPGHCAIVFRSDAVDAANPAYREWGERAYGVLVRTIERLARELAPDLDVDLAAALCWSTVEGLLTVHPPLQAMAERHGGTTPAIGDLAEQLIRLLVTGFVGPDH